MLNGQYPAQGPDAIYRFLAETLTGGVLVPVSRQVHGPADALQTVTEDTPLPVGDIAAKNAVIAMQAAVVAALGQILAKLIAAPATAQGQADQLAALVTLSGQTDGLEGSLTAILAKLTADPATAAAQAAALVKLTSMDGKLPTLSSNRLPAESDDRILASLIDEATAGTTYVCEAPAGTATSAAGWRVQKITVAAGVTRIQWAAGGAMTQIADNRAALVYA